MAISFFCPKCGRQSQVADEFAGHISQCPGCGQQVTVPADGLPLKPKSGLSGLMIGLIVAGVSLVVLLVCGGILTALLLPAVSAAREAARQTVCRNNLKQIALALESYASVKGHFPPACTVDRSGRPLHSWRTEILPFLEAEPWCDQIDRTKPWNDPKNKMMAGKRLAIFQCPSDPSPNTETHYMMVVGKDTVGGEPGGRGTSRAEITDGTSRTLMVVEVPGQGVPWMEPKDITIDELIVRLRAAATGQGRSPHPRGFNAATCDGAVHCLSLTIDAEILRRLARRNNGEAVNIPTN
jgi:type II secretory pathway pseudopilin PulG